MWTGQRNAAGQFVKKSTTQSYREIHARWRNKAKLTPEGRATMMVNKARTRATEKGYACTITKEWVADKIRKGVCEKTGIKFVLDGGNKHKHSPSLDQIVPGAGYTETNTRVVVWIFNQARNAFSDEELLDFAFLLVKKHFDSINLDDDDLNTPSSGAVAEDDNSDYWNSGDLVAVVGGSCSL
jgi:hypothetical protein